MDPSLLRFGDSLSLSEGPVQRAGQPRGHASAGAKAWPSSRHRPIMADGPMAAFGSVWLGLGTVLGTVGGF